jgi:hypothetical protein
MSISTPADDEGNAYRVAALPLEYGTARINQLFTRGYNRYIVDGEDQPEDLLKDLERFGTAAFKEKSRTDAAEEPFVDEPGILAVLATLSAICVKAYPKFEDVPPRTIQVLYDIRELYVNNLASLLRGFGEGSLQQVVSVQPLQKCQSLERDCIWKFRWLLPLENVSFVLRLRAANPVSYSLR